jgi:hypothetical protein
MPNYSNYAYSKGGGVRVWTNGFAINEPSVYGYVFLENTVVNYNLGKFTGKTYRSIVTGHIYYQIEANFNKTSGLSSITQGERAWVWAYDLFTQPHGSPDVTTNDTKKYSPPNEPQIKPISTSTATPTQATSSDKIDFSASAGTKLYFTPYAANIRSHFDLKKILRVTTAGEQIWVRPDLQRSDGYMPIYLGPGKGAGLIHISVVKEYKQGTIITNPSNNQNPLPVFPNLPTKPNEGGAGGSGDSTYLFGAVALGLLILTGGKSLF